jgi:hypothetical protein
LECGGPPPLFDRGPSFQSSVALRFPPQSKKTGYSYTTLCPFAALAFSRKTTRTGAEGSIGHPFYQRKRTVCTYFFARIRRPAHWTGDYCQSAKINLPIFGKALDRKKLLAKFKRSGE